MISRSDGLGRRRLDSELAALLESRHQSLLFLIGSERFLPDRKQSKPVTTYDRLRRDIGTKIITDLQTGLAQRRAGSPSRNEEIDLSMLNILRRGVEGRGGGVTHKIATDSFSIDAPVLEPADRPDLRYARKTRSANCYQKSYPDNPSQIPHL